MELLAIVACLCVLWYQFKDGGRNTHNEIKQVSGVSADEHARNKATIKRMTGVSDAEYESRDGQWYPGEWSQRKGAGTSGAGITVFGWLCAGALFVLTAMLLGGGH